MNSNDNAGRTNVRIPPSLRFAALIVALVGGLASVRLMLDVGQRNHSVFLLVLFTLWVFSPFVGLISASVFWKSESLLIGGTLYGLMLILTVASLAVYAIVAFGPPMAKVASVFLIVPLASWLLVGIVLAVAVFVSGRRSR